MKHIDSDTLRQRILKAARHEGPELAVVDVRETLAFSKAHLIFSSNLPLSRLELEVHGALPRLSVPVVLVDMDGMLVPAAAALLQRWGYTDVAGLAGGLAQWQADGGRVYVGFNVRSKAFAECVEAWHHTPSLDYTELADPAKVSQPHVLIDSRTWAEYQAATVPGAVHVAGADLTRQVRDLAPDAGTTVVVACGGRTRSIVGAQSLIAAAVPNRVFSLRNGTGGLRLAGHGLEHGASRTPAGPSPSALAWARAASEKRARQVPVIDADGWRRWRVDSSRTLYMLDLRPQPLFDAGHLPGAVAVSGGQLVQHVDLHAPVLGARVVLVDDPDLVRARMTAWWLQQLGAYEVVVMAQDDAEAVAGSAPAHAEYAQAVAAELPAGTLIDARTLERELATRPGQVHVLDLSRSTAFRRLHVPGAHWLMRDQLAPHIAGLPADRDVVLASDDGAMAVLALRDWLGRLDEGVPVRAGRVRALRGGNAAWAAAGFDTASGTPFPAAHYPDAWVGPENRGGDVLADTREYLDWEIALLHQVADDPEFQALIQLEAG